MGKSSVIYRLMEWTGREWLEMCVSESFADCMFAARQLLKDRPRTVKIVGSDGRTWPVRTLINGK
jgi:hypothetical protein